MEDHTELTKKPLRNFQTVTNKTVWSDDTKIELFGLNSKYHVWERQYHLTNIMKGGGGGSSSLP